jgi:hypothetical protein
MKAQLVEMHRATNLDERAWVVVTHVTSTEIDLGKPMGIIITYRNTGRTPALHIETRVRADALAPGQLPRFIYDDIQPTGTGVMGPNVEFLGLLNPIKTPSGLPGYLVESDYDAMFVLRTKVVYTHGLIKYSDIFGREHWTRFCFRLDIVPAISWNACEENNEMDNN